MGTLYHSQRMNNIQENIMLNQNLRIANIIITET